LAAFPAQKKQELESSASPPGYNGLPPPLEKRAEMPFFDGRGKIYA
jgi:hypothetical protein